MKGIVLLPRIEIRSFTPLTPAGKYVQTKRTLKKLIEGKINNIQKLRDTTLRSKILLEVCFYLNNNTKETGNWQKDLDNLLNVVFDVIPQHFTDEDNQDTDGLGLTEGKSDYMIHEVIATKIFVDSHEKEGLDIEISEWLEKK